METCYWRGFECDHRATRWTTSINTAVARTITMKCSQIRNRRRRSRPRQASSADVCGVLQCPWRPPLPLSHGPAVPFVVPGPVEEQVGWSAFSNINQTSRDLSAEHPSLNGLGLASAARRSRCSVGQRQGAFLIPSHGPPSIEVIPRLSEHPYHVKSFPNVLASGDLVEVLCSCWCWLFQFATARVLSPR